MSFYKIHRATVQPLSSRHRYTILEAYNWLASEAAWAPHVRKVRGKLCNIPVGAVLVSSRELAKKWNRHRLVIRRYLSVLKSKGVISQIRYNNGLKVLVIQLSKKVYQSEVTKNTSQLIDFTTTISKSRTTVINKSVPVPFTPRGRFTKNLSLLAPLSKVLNIEEGSKTNTNTNTVYIINDFNTLETNYMTLKKKPTLTLVQPRSDLQSLDPGCSLTCSCPKDIATAGTTTPLPPPKQIEIGEVQRFLPSNANRKPYPRGTDSPVLLNDSDVEYLEQVLGRPCLMYQAEALAGYAEDFPAKFRNYKNHRRVILRWDEMKRQLGLEFCPCHEDRPGYYPPHIVKEQFAKFRKRIGVTPVSS